MLNDEASHGPIFSSMLTHRPPSCQIAPLVVFQRATDLVSVYTTVMSDKAKAPLTLGSI